MKLPTSLFDPRIKLRHVSCVLEVARQQGVVAASEVLGLSQPAVSKSIAELESLLGIALFDRSGRKLVLNQAGEMFVRHAMTAAAALRQGIEGLDPSLAERNVVRLGALPTVEVRVVPRAVAKFAESSIACRVHVESGPSGHLLRLLRDGDLDFIVGRLSSPEAMRGLAFEQLYSEQLHFAVRPSHPLARRRGLTYRELESLTMLMPPQNAIIRPIVDSLFIAVGMGELRQVVETVSNSFARVYALENDAIWIVSRSVVISDIDAGELVALDVDTSSTHGPVGITTRANEEFSVFAKAMMDAVRQAAAQFAMQPSPV
jgi:LysR family pca operon transcriptional activator